jgi:hypothetical protein
MGNSAASPPDGRRLRWAQHRARRRAAFVEAGTRSIDRDGPAASAEDIADKHRRNDPDRTEMLKFCPPARKPTMHRETR